MAMASLRGATGPEADVSHVGVLAALIIEFQKELASELEQLLDSVELSDYGAAPKSARKRAPTSAVRPVGSEHSAALNANDGCIVVRRWACVQGCAAHVAVL